MYWQHQKTGSGFLGFLHKSHNIKMTKRGRNTILPCIQKWRTVHCFPWQPHSVLWYWDDSIYEEPAKGKVISKIYIHTQYTYIIYTYACMELCMYNNATFYHSKSPQLLPWVHVTSCVLAKSKTFSSISWQQPEIRNIRTES